MGIRNVLVLDVICSIWDIFYCCVGRECYNISKEISVNWFGLRLRVAVDVVSMLPSDIFLSNQFYIICDNANYCTVSFQSLRVSGYVNEIKKKTNTCMICYI